MTTVSELLEMLSDWNRPVVINNANLKIVAGPKLAYNMYSCVLRFRADLFNAEVKSFNIDKTGTLYVRVKSDCSNINVLRTAMKRGYEIEIAEKSTDKRGFACISGGEIWLHYGADDGSDDKSVSAKVFNKDFKITKVYVPMGCVRRACPAL